MPSGTAHCAGAVRLVLGLSIVLQCAAALSCSSYIADPSLASWTVACNANTADGYVWTVGAEVKEYGFYSIGGPGVGTGTTYPNSAFPPCDASTVGSTGMTWAWRLDSGPQWGNPVATAYCRRLDAAGTRNCPAVEGPEFACSSAHCGVYTATCTRQPGTADDGSSGISGTTIGIIVGCVVGGILILVLVCVCVRRSSERKEEAARTHEKEEREKAERETAKRQQSAEDEQRRFEAEKQQRAEQERLARLAAEKEQLLVAECMSRAQEMASRVVNLFTSSRAGSAVVVTVEPGEVIDTDQLPLTQQPESRLHALIYDVLTNPLTVMREFPSVEDADQIRARRELCDALVKELTACSSQAYNSPAMRTELRSTVTLFHGDLKARRANAAAQQNEVNRVNALSVELAELKVRTNAMQAAANAPPPQNADDNSLLKAAAKEVGAKAAKEVGKQVAGHIPYVGGFISSALN